MGTLTSARMGAVRAFDSRNGLDQKDLEAGWDPSAKVYVVDDDESIRLVMQGLMEMNGIGVATFASAEEFLAFYRPEFLGCLLLDVHMPGMGGFELQELLATKLIFLPIIFFTAEGTIPKAVRALKMGAVDFIEKPFDYREVCERLRQSLRLDARMRKQKNVRHEAACRLATLTQR
ncbi:MAG: response regulator transcription factor, partial [Burkholderiales bacterium]|nr:response regulator transcription factor [Burkholderiales bacterium]